MKNNYELPGRHRALDFGATPAWASNPDCGVEALEDRDKLGSTKTCVSQWITVW